MTDRDVSKLISYVLRHRPDSISLTLDANGWTPVDSLLDKLAANGNPVDRDTLLRVVATSDKKRFTLSDDGQLIRAAQGHSIEVDLAIAPAMPPETLYHGTADRFLASIRTQGLTPQSRRHVHLSADVETATKVGARHGRVVVLRVKAGDMHRAGHVFFQADNGVWLTDAVPPDFLED